MASSEFVNSFCPQKNLSFFFTQKQQKKTVILYPKTKFLLIFFLKNSTCNNIAGVWFFYPWKGLGSYSLLYIKALALTKAFA
jgi:hypothetical protein